MNNRMIAVLIAVSALAGCRIASPEVSEPVECDFAVDASVGDDWDQDEFEDEAASDEDEATEIEFEEYVASLPEVAPAPPPVLPPAPPVILPPPAVPLPELVPPPPAARPVAPLGVVGETEAIYIHGFKAPFEARIDTGATTSSIGAGKIRLFERDGVRWVSFQLGNPADGSVRNYEVPVVRVVRIKRHGLPSTRRISVMLTFRIGHLTLDREFTLVDRSNFRYPVLIGRNVINGLAVVDPSRRNLL